MQKSIRVILGILCFALLSCVLITSPSTVLASDTQATRLDGSDRYATSVNISRNGWSQATTVIIVSGMDFPDALSSSTLSKLNNAPILLTENNMLKVAAIAEIQRLKATKAIIVGGTGVISTNVENQLKNLGISITRIGGVNRYDTSQQVARLVGTTNGIVIAAGADFPDALSIATVAGIKSLPILLSPQNSLDPYIAGFIKDNSIPVSYLVGGTGVLSSAIDSSVPASLRLYGSDRYATNLAIINQFSGSFNFDTVYLVAGNDFPDALGGAALAAKNNAPVFLTATTSISSDTISFLKNHNVRHVVILGGTGVVSQNVEDTVDSALSGTLQVPPIVNAQNSSLYNTLKQEIISNMENRTTTFALKYNGTMQEYMNTTTQLQVTKDIMHSDPYDYYNISDFHLSVSTDNAATTLNFTLEYNTTKSQEDYVTAQINNILKGIIKTNMTTADKELAIHDWIVNNTQYDLSLTKYTAYDALAEHSAVCEGFALLTYRMLTQAGIQADIVIGTANNGQEIAAHSWNLANIDGNWYHLDTTWDDPISSSPILSHDYFNLTDAQIGKDHSWDKTEYPNVSQIPFIR